MTDANGPYAAEVEAERAGWYELAELVRSLTPQECLEPGYYVDPPWTVRDLVGHIGTWLAEAEHAGPPTTRQAIYGNTDN